MKQINTKFGILYIEEWEFDHHKPWQREEEDRVKIFDSNKNYLDYFSVESIEESAEFEGITPQDVLNELINQMEDFDTIHGLLDWLGLNDDLITTDRVVVENYLHYFDMDDDSDIEENEWVNKIGDYYIVVSEY